MAVVGQAPSWGKHFHDDSGSNPAVGWEVWTFESRTEDQIASYQDINGVVRHANPIILNSRGEYPGQGLFLTLDQAYTLELRRPGGSAVTTVDGVIVSSGGITISSITGSEYIDVDSTNPEVPVVSLNDAVIAMIEANSGLIAANEITINNNTYSIENNAGDIELLQIAQAGIITDLANKIDVSEKGIVGGVATLDMFGKVPENQLYGTVANVQEAYVVGSTPFASDWLSETSGGTALTPSDSTIYYILSPGSYENKEYRWGGSTYIELSASLVLGNTSSTAFQGDLGQIAYDHTLDVTTNPHNVTAEQVGLGNADNTSDADKPVSDAAQLLFDGTVNTSGDQSVSGTKFFSDTIVMHDGLSMDSYAIPSGGSSPEPGQVLRYPESGNVLEWADAAQGEEDAIAARGDAATAQVVDDNSGSSWYNTFTISQDNGLLDTEIDSDDAFDIDTGIFTAPEDGYYYVQAQANVKTAFTGTSTEETDARLRTYIQYGSIPQFESSNYIRSYLNRAIGCTSAGIIHMVAGETVYGVVECNVSASYTPSTHSTDAYIYRCSVSFHKLVSKGADGTDGVDGADGADGEGGVVSVNSELPDTAGNVALAASLIPTDDSNVQTELDSINETLSNLESATGSFTYDALLLTTSEQNLALTLVTQSSNTGIFEIDDADDTLNIKEVSNYINTINFVLSKTAALSVDMTYRIYNASGVEYFSEVITLTGNGTLTPSLTIDVKDRPIGEYYATIELDNTAGVYLQSSTNVTVVTTSVNSSLLYPPTITLSNIDSVTNTFGLLYKIASTTVSKPSYRDSQISQFDNSDCDPSISAGGRIRRISIHSAAMAVSTATVASTVYARVGVYSILTNANGGPVLLGEYDIPITPNANIGIYNDTGTPNGTKGSLSLDLSVPAGTLLGFQLINSSAFTGDNEYINAFRNTFVGISIY